MLEKLMLIGIICMMFLPLMVPLMFKIPNGVDEPDTEDDKT